MSCALGLNRRKVFGYLRRAGDALPLMSGRKIDMRFVYDRPSGEGSIKNYDGNISKMEIGIVGLSGQSKLPFARVDDSTFTKCLVALYHEYGHYLQDYGPDKDVSCLISETSVIGNNTYYRRAWKMLPHEIRAETVGVDLAWDAMLSTFPKQADTCMLNYINRRASETAYMLPEKQGGYRSRDEVMGAFEDAMNRSLTLPRKSLGGFFGYPDESIQLVTQGDSNFKLSPNRYHAGKLNDSVPGAQKDRMMAALVLELRPDAMDDRPLLKSENLTVEHEFGRPLVVKTLPGVRKSEYDERMASLSKLAARIGWADSSDDFESEAESEDDGPDFDF